MIFQLGYSYQENRNDILININYLASNKTFVIASFSVPSSFENRKYNFYNSYILGYKLNYAILSSKHSTFLFGVHRDSIENHENNKWYNVGINNFYHVKKTKFFTNFIYSFNNDFIDKSISINSILSLTQDVFVNFGMGYTSYNQTSYSFEVGVVL